MRTHKLSAPVEKLERVGCRAVNGGANRDARFCQILLHTATLVQVAMVQIHSR